MLVDRVAVARDAAVCAEVRVQVGDDLVAEEVEVDPGFAAAAFGEAEFRAVEFAGFGDVADLEGEVEGSEHGGVLAVPVFGVSLKVPIWCGRWQVERLNC